MICAHTRDGGVRCGTAGSGSRGPTGLHWSRSTSRRIRLACHRSLAAGVSFPIFLLTRGEYSDEATPPVRAESRCRSGSLRSRGLGFSAGDRVMAFTMLGGFADVGTREPALTLGFRRG